MPSKRTSKAAKERHDEEVRKLSRELHDVGVRGAEKVLGGGRKMLPWDDLQPHIQAGHAAIAVYVLRRFVRKVRG